MQLDITRRERQILIELLEFRVRELHPIICRGRVSAVTDERQHDLEDIGRLLEKVHSARREPESHTGM